MRIPLCILCVPIFVFAGLLLQVATSTSAHLTSELAAWMAIFMVSIFIPAHLTAFALVYLVLKNKIATSRPVAIILTCCALATVAIALPKSTNIFSLVFSWATVPLYFVTYAIAVGRGKPNNSFKPNPLRGSA